MKIFHTMMFHSLMAFIFMKIQIYKVGRFLKEYYPPPLKNMLILEMEDVYKYYSIKTIKLLWIKIIFHFKFMNQENLNMK